MKVIFAGTPEFAVPALAAIIEAGHQVLMVLTQPDRPAGRGMKLKASPVKQLAEQHGLPVYQPESLKPAEVQDAIAAVHADVMVVAAYGLIIPTTVLAMPTLGCYNIHASLLPRWRGAAPIHRALLAGDADTGVTIMEVVPKLDAGAMVSKWVTPIGAQDTTQSLHDRISTEGARLMVEALALLERDQSLLATPQDEALVTYAHKLEKAEGVIDWSQTAEQLSRQIRAFNPFPVAYSVWQDQVCKLWMAETVTGLPKREALPGQIISVDGEIVVACGQGALRVTELQLPGGKRLTAQSFLQGNAMVVGQCFGDNLST